MPSLNAAATLRPDGQGGYFLDLDLPSGPKGEKGADGFGTPLPANTKAIVAFNFTTATTARPTASTAFSVEWRGPVQPTNAIAGDTWVNTNG